MSKYEEHIEGLLKKAVQEDAAAHASGYSPMKYAKEVTFPTLKREGTPLRFDFALYKCDNLFCLIEVDGEHHFKQVKLFHSKTEFRHAKMNDRRKNKFCLVNGYSLYRVPFWDVYKLNSLTDILCGPAYLVTDKYHNDIIINLKKELK